MSAPVSVNTQAETHISDSCNCVSRCCIPRRRKKCHVHTDKKVEDVKKVVFDDKKQ